MYGLPRSLEARLESLVEERLGLVWAPSRRDRLVDGLRVIAREMGLASEADLDACLEKPREMEILIGRLAAELTINETYFFRDTDTFDLLEQELLPVLHRNAVAAGRPLRFWSAGCSTGEEAYSLAIAAHRSLGPSTAACTRILATDVDRRSLERAEKGEYGEWSFRGTPETVRAQFLEPVSDRRFRVSSDIRRCVDFRYLNLVDYQYPLAPTSTTHLDLIVCRNVLMYLARDHQKRITEALGRCLRPGGYLILAAVESSLGVSAGLEREQHRAVTLFRRSSGSGISPTRPARSWRPPTPARTRIPAIPTPSIPRPTPLPPAPRVEDQPPTPVEPQSTAPPAEVSQEDVARQLANRGDLEQARAVCEAAMKVSGQDGALHFLLATILEEQGDDRAAIEALRRVLYLNPEHVPAHMALARTYGRMGHTRASDVSLRVVEELLSAGDGTAALPHSDGMSRGRLLDAVQRMREEEAS